MSNPRFVSVFLLTLHFFFTSFAFASAQQMINTESQTPGIDQQSNPSYQAQKQNLQPSAPSQQPRQTYSNNLQQNPYNQNQQQFQTAPQQTSSPYPQDAQPSKPLQPQNIYAQNAPSQQANVGQPSPISYNENYNQPSHNPVSNDQWAYYLCNACTSRSGMIKSMRCSCDLSRSPKHFTTSDVLDYDRNSDNWHHLPCTVCKHVTNTKEMSCYCRIPRPGPAKRAAPRKNVAKRPAPRRNPVPQPKKKPRPPVQESPKPKPPEPEKVIEETTIINNYYSKKVNSGAEEEVKEEKYDNTKKYDDIDAEAVYKG